MTPRDSGAPRAGGKKTAFLLHFWLSFEGFGSTGVKQSVITPMPEIIRHPLPAQELGPCLCSQVRRTARRLSSLYDAALSCEELTITQYSLLANIARAGQLSHAIWPRRSAWNGPP
jgi:hypothetical protein